VGPSFLRRLDYKCHRLSQMHILLVQSADKYHDKKKNVRNCSWRHTLKVVDAIIINFRKHDIKAYPCVPSTYRSDFSSFVFLLLLFVCILVMWYVFVTYIVPSDKGPTKHRHKSLPSFCRTQTGLFRSPRGPGSDKTHTDHRLGFL